MDHDGFRYRVFRNAVNSTKGHSIPPIRKAEAYLVRRLIRPMKTRLQTAANVPRTLRILQDDASTKNGKPKPKLTPACRRS